MKPYIALSLLPLLAACGDKPAPPSPQPRVVLAFEVRAGAGATVSEYSGEVRARHEAALGFRVGGKLVERRVEVGDRVAAGQVLARLDAGDLSQSQRGAEAQQAAAEAEVRFARAELERYRGLHTQKFVSQAALEAKETALKAAEEKLRAAGAQGVIARNQTTYADLSSDRPGVVAAVLAEAGQVVAAGQPVLRVAQGGEREVVIALPENRVAEAAPGVAARVTLWALPDKAYQGRVREVAPQADAITRTYAARVAITNADAQVRLGQTARVLFQGGKPEGKTTLLPSGAVFQKDKQAAVWVIAADGRVHLRPVQVSAWREDGAAVSAGVSEGERIVAAGAYKLMEGETVRVADGRRP
ncbi:MAG: efflux RND transporter periplasmic adaptor subunit [Betaproteobacteria bacterium]|nr:efflux RND transporter periplasmic adaptor subunit [Betaproteobacteria bacterium]